MFRTAKYLFLAYALAAGALILFAAPLRAPSDLPGLLFIYAWLMGPALLAAVCVRFSQRPEGAGAFLAAEVLIALSTGAMALGLILPAGDPLSAGLRFILLPLAQYAILFLVWVAALALGWHPRRDWP